MKISKEKLKILIIGYLPPPPEGTAKMTEMIVNAEFLRNRYEMQVFSLRKSKSVAGKGRFSFENIKNNLLNFLEYLFRICRFKPDIIYMPLAQNRFGFLRDSVFVLLGKMLKRKIIVHFHGANFDEFINNQKGMFCRYISSTLNKFDHLILLGAKFKNQFTAHINEEKISILYNCVSEIPHCVKTESDCEQNNDIVRLLFIGHLSVAKGAVDVTKATAEIINRSNTNLNCTLCGTPMHIERNVTFISDPHAGYNKLKTIIKENNLESKFKIITELTNEQKQDLFINSDIFIFPSYSEGCGLVAMEAMSYGLPVVVTNSGALEEMLEENKNCFFVTPGNIEDIIEKIMILINDRKLRNIMGVNNRKLIEVNFNSEVYARNLAAIWSCVV
jgi:glycosyltransferase involved in cell wall biosynthesis